MIKSGCGTNRIRDELLRFGNNKENSNVTFKITLYR